MSNLNDLTAALINARGAKEDCAAALKAANAKCDEATLDLFEAMVEAELPKITANGFGFALDTKSYFRVDPDDMGHLRMSMTSRGLGGIFRYTAHAGTLQAALRELETQNGGALPEGIKKYAHEYQKPSVSVRKAK